MLPPGSGFAKAADDARQPLGHDAPARPAARVHGPAGARPVRPRAADRRDRRPAGCCSSRRTSARRRARWTCRWARSGPGSRSTRPPTRSSSRRTRGCGRTSPDASSASWRCSATDASSLGREAIRSLGAALRGDGRRDDQHWLERLMSDEQRQLFRETQAVMSLLEGFGDHVMDAVGKDLVPGVERISARFHGRRQQRTPFERAMLRITGLDLKMEQYRKGEVFVAEIERLGGRRGAAAAVGRAGDAADARRDRRPGGVGAAAWGSTGSTEEARDRRGHRARRGRAPGPAGRPGGDRPDADPRGALAGRATSRRSAPPRPGRGSSRSASTATPTGRSTTSRSCSAAACPAELFDRILARAPELRWVHSATAGVERVLTPALAGAAPRDHQRARRVLAADRRVRDADDPRRLAPAAVAARAPGRSGRGSRSSRASCAT